MTMVFKSIFKFLKYPLLCMLALAFMYSSSCMFGCCKGGGVMSRTSEGKLKLASVINHQVEFYKKNKRYTARLEEVEASFYPGGRYVVGSAYDGGVFQRLCPDCVISGHKFKFVAIGNIDDDDTLDAWTYNEEKKFEHISNDF